MTIYGICACCTSIPSTPSGCRLWDLKMVAAYGKVKVGQNLVLSDPPRDVPMVDIYGMCLR